MLISMERVLVQLNGQPLMDQDSDGNVVKATVRTALVNVALAPDPKDDGVKKVQKYELAKRLYIAKDDAEVSLEEAQMLKKKVEEVYPPLICGQLVAILEGKS